MRSKVQNNCPVILVLHCQIPEHLATLRNCLREQDLYAESTRAGQFQDSPLTHIKQHKRACLNTICSVCDTNNPLRTLAVILFSFTFRQHAWQRREMHTAVHSEGLKGRRNHLGDLDVDGK
jgi:hypothetical protein